MFALFIALLSPVSGVPQREIATMAFPDRKADNSEYLGFVLEIAKATNPGAAKKLEESYGRLRAANDRLAEQFLKGIRYEMVQKLELVGLAPRRMTTDSVTMRRWVDKYLATWVREADEYEFRAYAASIAKRTNDVND